MNSAKHYKGLTSAQVAESREAFGVNVLTPPKREPLWKLFLEKFEDPVIRILLIAALLSLLISVMTSHYAETIGIFVAIFLATGVSFWFEYDAGKKFDILNQVKDEEPVKVIRDDHVGEVCKKDIVVNDIVLLSSGDEVPADGELLESISLQVDESSLTGEPLVDKTALPSEFDRDATYPSDRVMRGTMVIDGHATMQVLKVGDKTEFGIVADKAMEISGHVTPLNKQLDQLARFIGVVGFALAILTFISLLAKDLLLGGMIYSAAQLVTSGIVMASAVIVLVKVWMPVACDAHGLLSRGKAEAPPEVKGGWAMWFLLGLLSFLLLSGFAFMGGINVLGRDAWISFEQAGRVLQYFMVSVTLIVVAVPEGLPMSVTLSLALSMRRMLAANNLVRKMHACETMGATTVICTDKTGTLTQNKMQVDSCRIFSLKENRLGDDVASALFKECVSVNSTAHIDCSDAQNIKTIGNPTEAAMLLWLQANQVNYLDIRESVQVVEQIPFSTERKYMATVVESPVVGKKVLYVKGAPEIVLSHCRGVQLQDAVSPLEAFNEEIQGLLDTYQAQAMRTIGFACEIMEDSRERFEHGKLVNTNLKYLGVFGITDPVRADVPDAVRQCVNAGIEVKIVTGDTPGTAKEIGRQIGIWGDTDTERHIISGLDFSELSDMEAAERARHLKIMCRARPTDKQRLVQLLKKNGAVVAVTGDGTNDAPALNHAHVGLSMGSGTFVAKEASDITIVDDSFNSIASAVMWGRSVYINIQRFVLFQLTINVAALVIVLLGSFFGRELPLTVTQMLWINLVMDTFAAGALASLPPNRLVMNHKPRNSDAFIITPQMRNRILSVGFAFVGILLLLLNLLTDRQGNISRYDLSRFFTVFVMLQFWNMFNARAFSSGKSAFHGLGECGGFLVVAALIVVGQIVIVQFGGEVFRTVPLSLSDWLLIISSTSAVLWIGELIRVFKGRAQKVAR